MDMYIYIKDASHIYIIFLYLYTGSVHNHSIHGHLYMHTHVNNNQLSSTEFAKMNLHNDESKMNQIFDA